MFLSALLLAITSLPCLAQEKTSIQISSISPFLELRHIDGASLEIWISRIDSGNVDDHGTHLEAVLRAWNSDEIIESSNEIVIKEGSVFLKNFDFPEISIPLHKLVLGQPLFFTADEIDRYLEDIDENGDKLEIDYSLLPTYRSVAFKIEGQEGLVIEGGIKLNVPSDFPHIPENSLAELIQFHWANPSVDIHVWNVLVKKAFEVADRMGQSLYVPLDPNFDSRAFRRTIEKEVINDALIALRNESWETMSQRTLLEIGKHFGVKTVRAFPPLSIGDVNQLRKGLNEHLDGMGRKRNPSNYF